MKKIKVIFTYKMDLSAFINALNLRFFMDKKVTIISMDGAVYYPFGSQRVMSLCVPLHEYVDKKGREVSEIVYYEIVGSSDEIESMFNFVCNLRKEGNFSI